MIGDLIGFFEFMRKKKFENSRLKIHAKKYSM